MVNHHVINVFKSCQQRSNFLSNAQSDLGIGERPAQRDQGRSRQQGIAKGGSGKHQDGIQYRRCDIGFGQLTDLVLAATSIGVNDWPDNEVKQ